MVDNSNLKDNLKIKAIIFGGTGATGRILIKNLLKLNEYKNIIIVTRSELTEWKTFSNSNKINVIKIENLDFINSDKNNIIENSIDLNKINSVFSCLGGDPTNIETIEKVDYEYTINIAKFCVKYKIPNFTLVSTKSANENSLFEYLKIKGKADNIIISLPINNISIFRPPLLEDRCNARFLEKVLSYVPFYSKIKINDLVKAIIIDDINRNKKINNEDYSSVIKVYELKDIISLLMY